MPDPDHAFARDDDVILSLAQDGHEKPMMIEEYEKQSEEKEHLREEFVVIRGEPGEIEENDAAEKQNGVHQGEPNISDPMLIHDDDEPLAVGIPGVCHIQ